MPKKDDFSVDIGNLNLDFGEDPFGAKQMGDEIKKDVEDIKKDIEGFKKDYQAIKNDIIPIIQAVKDYFARRKARREFKNIQIFSQNVRNLRMQKCLEEKKIS